MGLVLDLNWKHLLDIAAKTICFWLSFLKRTVNQCTLRLCVADFSSCRYVLTEGYGNTQFSGIVSWLLIHKTARVAVLKVTKSVMYPWIWTPQQNIMPFTRTRDLSASVSTGVLPESTSMWLFCLRTSDFKHCKSRVSVLKWSPAHIVSPKLSFIWESTGFHHYRQSGRIRNLYETHGNHTFSRPEDCVFEEWGQWFDAGGWGLGMQALFLVHSHCCRALRMHTDRLPSEGHSST